MKVILKNEDFLKLLRDIQDITDSKGTKGRPILSQIHIHATESRILFSASNLETAMVVAVKA